MKTMLILLQLLTATAAFADAADKEYLYLAFPNGVLPLSEKSLLPSNRMLALSRGKDGALVYVLTDSFGALTSPRELIEHGSILPARVFGFAPTAGSFQLGRDGRWRKTAHKSGRLWLHVETSPPTMRREWYPERIDLAAVVAASERLLSLKVRARR